MSAEARDHGEHIQATPSLPSDAERITAALPFPPNEALTPTPDTPAEWRPEAPEAPLVQAGWSPVPGSKMPLLKLWFDRLRQIISTRIEPRPITLLIMFGIVLASALLALVVGLETVGGTLLIALAGILTVVTILLVMATMLSRLFTVLIELVPRQKGGWIWRGHTFRVNCLAVSPDGRYLLSGGNDQILRLWRLDTGEEVRQMAGHQAAIRSVAFSPDGRFAVSGSGISYGAEPPRAGPDCQVHLWSVDEGRELLRLAGHQAAINVVAYAADGKQVLSTGDDGAARLWNVVSGALVRCMVAKQDQAGDTSFFAVKSTGLQQWLELLSIRRTVAITAAALLPDGVTALIGAGDGSLHLADLVFERILRSFPQQAAKIAAVAVSPDGRRGLSGSARTVRLWDLNSEKARLVYHLKAPAWYGDMIGAVAFSPDGQRALIGGGDGTVRLLDLTTGEEIRSYRGHGVRLARFLVMFRDVTCVAFAPDGRHAFSGGRDGTIRVWALEQGVE